MTLTRAGQVVLAHNLDLESRGLVAKFASSLELVRVGKS
jgi:hypothetical protein